MNPIMKHPPALRLEDSELLQTVQLGLDRMCDYIEVMASLDEAIACLALIDQARRRVDRLQADNRRYR